MTLESLGHLGHQSSGDLNGLIIYLHVLKQHPFGDCDDIVAQIEPSTINDDLPDKNRLQDSTTLLSRSVRAVRGYQSPISYHLIFANSSLATYRIFLACNIKGYDAPKTSDNILYIQCCVTNEV